MKGPYNVTVAFQADNLTAGYFVYMRSRLKHGLNNAADGIGATMSGLMVDCEPSLFNDLTLAAVGIDPKNSFVLELDPLFNVIDNKIINQLTKLVMQIQIHLEKNSHQNPDPPIFWLECHPLFKVCISGFNIIIFHFNIRGKLSIIQWINTYYVLEMEVTSTNKEVSVAFNNQEELIIDCDVLPGWLFFL